MIRVEGLTYTYAKSQTAAVRGLDFDVERGEIFGFLGPSGAGKSTTQKVLIGLLDDFGGQVCVLDKDVSTWVADDYERIGVSFETPNHFLKLTGLENLRYFAALYQERTHVPSELLARVGLEADGTTQVGQYSKGMKNRLSIARCLLNDPELLFLDEPTTGLDPVNAQRIKDIIRSERDAGKTVFLTTHDMSVADELCDRVAFIVEGEIARIDAPRALKLQYGQRAVRVEYLDDGRSGHEDFPLDGLAANEAFLAVLNDHDVQTMHTREASLSDVFIRVTGRGLE
ncbi:MAG: ABC transporter ATP-binding protein [Planctomycetota bacterium]|jgi:fluoroquinolone transport system ATP-binding protein